MSAKKFSRLLKLWPEWTTLNMPSLDRVTKIGKDNRKIIALYTRVRRRQQRRKK